jgi:hypothetical protein
MTNRKIFSIIAALIVLFACIVEFGKSGTPASNTQSDAPQYPHFTTDGVLACRDRDTLQNIMALPDTATDAIAADVKQAEQDGVCVTLWAHDSIQIMERDRDIAWVRHNGVDYFVQASDVAGPTDSSEDDATKRIGNLD